MRTSIKTLTNISSELTEKNLENSLSTGSINHLLKMVDNKVDFQRQSWDETFLNIAKEIAKRSPDSETQVGAVIVNSDKKIIGVGYNGWMPGINDDLIPNTRPLKHEWAIHSELNAILNCEHKPKGATIYCTHKPCQYCFFAIAIVGIKEIVHPKNKSKTTNHNDEVTEIAEFLTRKRIKIREI